MRLFWLCLLLLCALNPAMAADRPNIVFIFTDDHASHAIGAYGGWLSGVNPTPQIDRLAADGMLFQNCFCTNSICGPSRAVIQTGKHSHLNGFRHNGDRFDATQQTFPKLLRSAGYRTAMIGKWHLHAEPTGFDHWEVLPGQGVYYNPDFRTPEGQHRREGYCTDIITDLSIAWMKQQAASGQPFMLMCQHKAPHREWDPPKRYLTLYDDVVLPEPSTLFDNYKDNASPARWQEMEVARHMRPEEDLKRPPRKVVMGDNPDRYADRWLLRRMSPAQRAVWVAAYEPKNKAFYRNPPQGPDLVRWNYQRYLKDYLRCVRAVDDSVGQLRAELEELGIADNTIVIYSSDQGFYLGDHGWYDKRWMYEESLRMPLLVHWPGVTTPGGKTDALAQNLDFAQTFLDMAGVTPPDDMQGQSLVPLLHGEKPGDWRKGIYYHYYEYPSVHMVPKHNGVRTERYKLMHFYEYGEWEFYDLAEDPDEMTNAYGSPRYADTIARLKGRLVELEKQYQDDSDLSPKPAEWQAQFRKPGVGSLAP